MRPLLLGIVVACTGLLGAGWARTAPAPSVRVTEDHVVVHNQTRDDVRVEYEIVRLPDDRAPKPAPPQRAAVSRLAHVATLRPGVVERARRLIVGDGRHKPQPFPMVRPE